METIATKTSSPRAIINKMLEIEQGISKLPGAKFGDDTCPLNHTFADGLYIREIFMPKGMLISSRLHKTNSPYFVLEGDLSVFTGEGKGGLVRIKAPFWGVTKAGTKRILYIHEDTRWITVHATDETDLEKIEDVLIAKSYDELPEQVRNLLESKVERDKLCRLP